MWGPVKYVLSDHSTHFTCKKWNQTLSSRGISTRISLIYHPETDSQSESSIQTLSDQIKILKLQMNLSWDRVVQTTTEAVNNCYFITTGFQPIRIIDNKRNLRNDPTNEIHINQNTVDIKIIRKNLEISQKKMKTTGDKKRKEHAEWPILSYAYLRNLPSIKQQKDISPRDSGPFQIVGKKSPITYQILIRKDGKEEPHSFHINHLKRHLL
jgi:hypothetical protein